MTWVDDLALPYAVVNGWFVRVYGDSQDEDLHPDVQPISGDVTLIPSIRSGVIDGVSVRVEDVQAVLFGGELLSMEHEPLRILATDVTLGAEAEFTWTARISADGIAVKTIPFKAPAGSTVDLADHVKVEVIHEGGGVYRLSNRLGMPLTVEHASDGTYQIGA